MLVLKRNLNEWIDLTLPDGTRLAIQLVATWPGKARLGIEAPRSVTIMRREVTEEIERLAKQED